MGFARKNFSHVPIWLGHLRSWHLGQTMTEPQSHKPAQEATSEVGGEALAALAKALARAAARKDFAAERNSGHEQHDKDPDHE